VYVRKSGRTKSGNSEIPGLGTDVSANTTTNHESKCHPPKNQGMCGGARSHEAGLSWACKIVVDA